VEHFLREGNPDISTVLTIFSSDRTRYVEGLKFIVTTLDEILFNESEIQPKYEEKIA
jgi:hypothetical protein